ncbi:MAG: hypothetical protein P1P88_15685, partial [Bacteroidales bacterium]|nr:hypothetical protein [Bacteroidales bacterium]
MYKVKRIIQGVTKFILDEKLLHYKKDNSIYKEDSIFIELGEDFFGEFYINNKYLIIQDFKENEIKIYDNKMKIKTLTGFYNYLVQ